MELRQRILLFMVLSMTMLVHAQQIQVVDTDGNPIAYVCVTNEKGILIGSTDIDGRLDDVKGSTVINLSHVAFQDKVVNMADVSDGKIVMEDVEFTLQDVEVKPKELVYVQTYFRMIYFDDEGPIYFRGGVIDNTYELAKKKASSKTRSLSKGSSGLIRFLLSTLAGRYIDRLGQIRERSTYQNIQGLADKGSLILTPEESGRVLVSDTICNLGYIDTDMEEGTRTTSFNRWVYNDHLKAAEAKAKGKESKKKKDEEKDKEDASDIESFFEVYRIDSERRSRIDDFVMRQMYVESVSSRSGSRYVILLQAYTTDRDYIDKKEYKQLRKENKVDMEIDELRRFEQAHKIPPLAPDIQAQIDQLFKKDKK